MPTKVLCDECSRYFHDKSTLNRHKKKIHGVEYPIIIKIDNSEVLMPEYFCEPCERYFFNKTSLSRHRVAAHNFIDPTVKSLLKQEKYSCSFCPKKFSKKQLMFAHIRRNHPTNIYQKHLLEARLCELCGQNFANKSCLLRHKRTIHRGKMNPDSSSEEEIEMFQCYHCHRSFRRKDSLVSHLRAKHPFIDDGSNLFECNECGKKFTRKHAIRRHLLTIHANNEVKTANFKCTLCHSAFHLRHIAKTHYVRDHGIKLFIEKLKFDTMDDFEVWRKEIQRKYVTMFVRSYISKTSEYTVTRYICHRSGLYRDHSKNAPRKRSLKEWGSKKIQGYCPAEIMLQIRQDGYHVQFQSEHVGHAVASMDELHHIFLDKEQKRMVAEKLIEGVPRTEIVKALNLSSEQQDQLGRLSILNFKDVDNIARSFGIRSRRRTRYSSGDGGGPSKRSRRSPAKDAIEEAFAEEETIVEALEEIVSASSPASAVETNDNVVTIESYVIQNKDAFLFYKSQGEEDIIFGTLEKEDYFILLMDQSQAENLQRYGHKVVGFDSTHRADFYEFLLHTLFVFDANYNEIPVAFLVSNRNDQPVIDIFIRCICERVGCIAPQTIISDLHIAYYNSWVSFMEPPQFYLFCSSHVNEEWCRLASKIPNEEKRFELLQQLVNIEQELDEVVFEQKLNTFVSADDNDLRDFLEYFRTIFYENTKHWAWCYRKFAGANTNDLIKEFHYRTLKQQIAGGNRIKTLSEGLRYLESYLSLREKGELMNELQGCGQQRKSEELKKNHQLAAQYYASIVHIDEQTWQIVSFQDRVDSMTEIFTIEKVMTNECIVNDEANCELLCDECGICCHEYRCSCVESCIHSIMCKHIHVLGFYLQTHKLLELKEVDTGDYAVTEIENLVEVGPSSPAVGIAIGEEITSVPYINEDNSIELCINEVITDDVPVGEVIPKEGIKILNPYELSPADHVKGQILEEVQNALSSAKVIPDLDEIRERFIQPLKLKLMDDKVTSL